MTDTLSIRVDHDLKESFDKTCDDLGLTMTTAITVFMKKMTREQRVPFEVSNDPFYSESNMNYLRGIWNDMQTGKAHFAEHELIEVDDE